MPLDPSIPLAVRPPQGLNIAGAMREAASLKQLALQSDATEQQIASNQQDMQQRQHAMQQQAAVEQAWREAFVDVDGVKTLDRAKITTRLAQQGIDPTHVLKGLDDADTALRNKQKAQRELEAADNDAIAGLAYSIDKAGNTPEAWDTGMKYLQANNAADAAKLKPYDDAVKADPANIGKITSAIIAKSEKYTKIAQADRTADLTEEQRTETRLHNQNMETLAGLAGEHTVERDKEIERHNKAMERFAQQNANTAARRAGSLFAPELPDNIETAASRATLMLPMTRRGPIVETINRLAKEGKLDDVKDIIRQAAIEGENVDAKNQIRGRQATIASLEDTRSILAEMKAAGVPTNWFVGTAEDLARKLGTTTNPEYVRLSTRLMGTLINYRRAATGVQFGQLESAQYEKMFPNYKNTLPVNAALIDGLERELKTYDRVYWENKLGKEGAELVGATPAAKASAHPEGTPGTLNGVPVIWKTVDGKTGWYKK